MSKLPISICIIAKNEEKYLEECLKRIKPYGFEIVLTDTGSTDRTKEIAYQYADKVVDFEWVEDFSVARNFCAQQASNDWILVLDCDEYVDSIDTALLQQLIKAGRDNIGHMEWVCLMYDANRKLQHYTEFIPRMYNRKSYVFRYPIHEQIVPKHSNIHTGGQFQIPMKMIHYGYAVSKEEEERKETRNITMLQNALKADPDNAYYMFQLAISYYSMQEYEKARDYYKMSLQHNDDCAKSYMPHCITGLAKSYVQLDDTEAALQVLNQYEDKCRAARISYEQAMIYISKDDPMKCLFYLLKTIAMKDFDTIGNGKSSCYELASLIYKDFGQQALYEEYHKKYEQCAKEDQSYTMENIMT